jgi:predicted negative regulator of RcsB-dependent stress response
VESYRTEEEQVEALKRWWQENGRSMIVSVVVAVGLGLGWNYWQAGRQASLENASFTYQQMLQRLAQGTPGDIATAQEEAEMLMAEHGATAYAKFAALHLARLLVTQGNAEEAEEKLRWVVDEADGELQAIARMRLARVLAERGATEEALDMLAAGQGGELAASFAIARGDVLLAAGRDDEARLAYDAALAALDPGQAVPAALQEKISYLNPQQPVTTDPEAG